MKTLKITIVLLLIIFTLSGCSAMLAAMFGVKPVKEFSVADYQSFLSKIPEEIEYISIISTEEQFKNVIKQGIDSIQKHALSQPVQILYFRQNHLVSFHANCYARGGFGGLDWNTDNRFSVFIPRSAVTYDISNILLDNYSTIFPEISLKNENYYTIIIFWTNLIRRISFSAIETVIENAAQFNKLANCRIYLINTDKFYAYLANRKSSPKTE